MKNIAVILCGSGYLDGSEIREAVAVLWALSKEKVNVHCFAPDATQADVVNCLTGATAANETRNMLVESARIARGKVRPLSELNPKEVDAVVIPGGFGAAKNLCTFAKAGAKATIRPDVEKIIQDTHHLRKPIGAICIAPAIVALALKGKGVELTVGERGEAAQEIEKLGHKTVATRVDEAHADRQNRVFSTGAYMYDDAPLHEVFAGIEKVIREVCR